MNYANATFQIWRGDASDGKFETYSTEIAEGMVVLDAVHQIQAEQANEWLCAGIVKPVNAVPARRKSMVCLN